MTKLVDIILYGFLGGIVIGAGLMVLTFGFVAVTKPEVIEEMNYKTHQQLVGFLINDGCSKPEVTKAFFNCPRNETSYRFKCTKNDKLLTGILCENGFSAYIRYDLNNFAQ